MLAGGATIPRTPPMRHSSPCSLKGPFSRSKQPQEIRLCSPTSKFFSVDVFFLVDQVLSLAPWDSSAGAAEGKTSEQPEQTGGQLSPNGQVKSPPSSKEVPVVNVTAPGTMSLSARVAGVKVVVYLNSAAALSRAGVGVGGFSEPGELLTLFESCVKEVEGCVELDFARWKVRGGGRGGEREREGGREER